VNDNGGSPSSSTLENQEPQFVMRGDVLSRTSTVRLYRPLWVGITFQTSPMWRKNAIIEIDFLNSTDLPN
jgi:hypothetical protein